MVRLFFHSCMKWVRGWGWVRLKLDVHGQGGGNILEVDGHGWWEVLKIRQFSWTSHVYRPLIVKRMSMSTVSFLAQLDSGILFL